MLLPALASAREKARRSACVNNLNQLGKASASYTADYGGYFPSWTAGGSKIGDAQSTAGAANPSYSGGPFPMFGTMGLAAGLPGYNSSYGIGTNTAAWAEFGIYTEPGLVGKTVAGGTATGKVITMIPAQPVGAFMTGFRTIFQGYKYYSTSNGLPPAIYAAPSTAWLAGDVNLAPNGMGMFCSSGYLPDAGAYYCPSATNMGDDFTSDPVAAPHLFTTFGTGAISTLSEVKGFCKGLDAYSIMHGGPWSGGYNAGMNAPNTWATGNNTYTGQGRFIQSSYNYRLVPAFSWISTTDGYFPRLVRLRGVRPDRVVWNGEPCFKTDKQLADRALISDTFNRACRTGETATYTIPGYGNWAHQDGYNVLYGDYHASWFGDAEKRLTWWAGGNSYNGGLWTACIQDFSTPGDTPLGTFYGSYSKNGALKMWHMLDLANGVDVGVDKSVGW